MGKKIFGRPARISNFIKRKKLLSHRTLREKKNFSKTSNGFRSNHKFALFLAAFGFKVKLQSLSGSNPKK